MQAQLSVHQWLQLPSSVRVTLASIFKLKRSEGSFVENNVVKSDGHTYHDLAAITIPAMQAYLLDTNEADFFRLFDRVVELVVSNDTGLSDAKEQAERRSLISQWTTQIQAIRQQALQAGFYQEFTDLLKNIFIPGSQPEVETLYNKPFCNFCTSHGFRHTKTCTRNDEN